MPRPTTLLTLAALAAGALLATDFIHARDSHAAKPDVLMSLGVVAAIGLMVPLARRATLGRGALVGAAIGTVLLPGLGTQIGAALGAWLLSWLAGGAGPLWTIVPPALAGILCFPLAARACAWCDARRLSRRPLRLL